MGLVSGMYDEFGLMELDCEELSDEELLKAYTDQQKVERGFRFLKNPMLCYYIPIPRNEGLIDTESCNERLTSVSSPPIMKIKRSESPATESRSLIFTEVYQERMTFLIY